MSHDKKKQLEVDKRLDPNDLRGMIFLCREIVKQSEMASIKRGIELFKHMEKTFRDRTVNGTTYIWHHLLEEVLYHVGRKDLLKILGTSKETLNDRLKTVKLVDCFTLLLFEIRQQITPAELNTLKFHYGCGSAHIEAVTDPLDFFLFLERRDEIGASVEGLQDLAEKLKSIERNDIKRLVLKMLEQYKATQPAAEEQGSEERSLVRGIVYPPPPPPITLPSRPTPPVQRVAPRQEPQHRHDDMPRYDMTRSKRGYCLIINNTQFFYNGDADCRELKNRDGSDMDRDKLKPLFEKLGFIVCVQENKTAQQLTDLIKEYSVRDHRDLDCLVVFILSHGLLGGVYGTDGRPVELKNITSPFRPSQCPSLANKPKVFFVQACQGHQTQESVQYNSTVADAPASHDHPNLAHTQETLPNEADFLLAYASVPGFVSYRSMSKGSWFINTLVKELANHHKHHDLLAILTKVNQVVGDATAKIQEREYKQTPAPTSTLRKKIYWP